MSQDNRPDVRRSTAWYDGWQALKPGDHVQFRPYQGPNEVVRSGTIRGFMPVYDRTTGEQIMGAIIGGDDNTRYLVALTEIIPPSSSETLGDTSEQTPE